MARDRRPTASSSASGEDVSAAPSSPAPSKPTHSVPTTPRAKLGLFDAFGLEIEYMFVDAQTLDVAPICDAVLKAEAGRTTDTAEHDDVTWCNELALHQIEMKVNNPGCGFAGFAKAFQRHVQAADTHAQALGCRLMPTGLHPWMDPRQQTRLWTHTEKRVIKAFTEVFDCHDHGWSNLQATHLNLPFRNEQEFARLHAAVRIVLPLIPALAASTPAIDGALSPQLDTRIAVYRQRRELTPDLVGPLIPEPIYRMQQYQDEVLAPMYEKLAEQAPETTALHNEWVNLRGATARFERNAIELRLIDAQECPQADVAVAAAVVAVLRLLAQEQFTPLAEQKQAETEMLQRVLDHTLWLGDAAPIDEPEYLRLLGWNGGDTPTAGAVWRWLVEQADPPPAPSRPLELILEQGCLAKRIRTALGRETQPSIPLAGEVSHPKLQAVYERLCGCLLAGEMLTL